MSSVPTDFDPTSSANPPEDDPAARSWTQSEDLWAMIVAATLLLICAIAVLTTASAPSSTDNGPVDSKPVKLSSPLKGWVSKPGSWGEYELPSGPASEASASIVIGNPLESFAAGGKSLLPGILGVFVISTLLFGAGAVGQGGRFTDFAKGFAFIFGLATLAYVLAAQAFVKHYNLEYALWALGAGLLISNTIGTPQFVRPALKTEFFIKTGLVMLGAEVLISRLIELGIPGIFVAWIVTPIVLISTYIFGQKVLKIESRSLNMVISADMSVCGVSAAIATAAACKAKKEELSFAIGLSLTFTVIMMVLLPALIRILDLSPVLGGAWLGGTIDSTGAVAAAGGLLGDVALETASTVKMIQNILIGVTAFGVAVYWTTYVERSDDAEAQSRPQAAEIWRRFPKFVLGFVGASLIFTALYAGLEQGPSIVNAIVKDTTKTFRGWFFCLAFVSIGLETNFRQLAQFLKGGKPLVLYICGQSLNLLLTLFMAWLMFEVIFRDMTAKLLEG